MPYGSITQRGVILLCFPPGDHVFSGIVQRHVRDHEETEEQLETFLRTMYPSAKVRARDRLAALTGPAWYVYRDGAYSPFVLGEPWWERPDAARLVLGHDGRYLDASAAALDLLRVDIDKLRTANAGDFTVPEYRANVPWVMQLLRDTGEVHSTSMLRPGDGSPDEAVEFHMALGEDPSNGIVAAFRRVPFEAVRVTPLG